VWYYGLNNNIRNITERNNFETNSTPCSRLKCLLLLSQRYFTLCKRHHWSSKYFHVVKTMPESLAIIASKFFIWVVCMLAYRMVCIIFLFKGGSMNNLLSWLLLVRYRLFFIYDLNAFLKCKKCNSSSFFIL